MEELFLTALGKHSEVSGEEPVVATTIEASE